ncbi:MAG: type II toxin-antitoxin system Phd/YefM family antitoxin [Desulfobacteraceae bacterium]|jgi:prevent-host-death family protein
MKTIPVTDFRKNASSFINEVEHGETLILIRRGKPVAEIIPFSGRPQKIPAWKQPSARLQIEGSDLSSAILEDRKASI